MRCTSYCNYIIAHKADRKPEEGCFRKCWHMLELAILSCTHCSYRKILLYWPDLEISWKATGLQTKTVLDVVFCVLVIQDSKSFTSKRVFLAGVGCPLLYNSMIIPWCLVSSLPGISASILECQPNIKSAIRRNDSPVTTAKHFFLNPLHWNVSGSSNDWT